MTYYVPDRAPEFSEFAPREFTGLVSGIGTATKQALLNDKANFRPQREAQKARDERSYAVEDRIPIDALNAYMAEASPDGYTSGPTPQTLDEFRQRYPTAANAAILEVARREAESAPEAWSDVDLSEEAVQGEVNEVLGAEDRDLEQIMDAMPWGRGAAEFMGGIASGPLDIRNLPWLFVGGGGGSVLRVFAQEALLNSAAEATQYPGKVEMADRLGKPAPDFLGTIVEAAVAGGILGGGIHGLSRALKYWRGRNTVPEVRGSDRRSSEAVIGAAESALERGVDPVAAIRMASDEALVARASRSFGEAVQEARARASDVRVPEALEVLPEAPERPAKVSNGEPRRSAEYAKARERDPEAFQMLEDIQRRQTQDRPEVDAPAGTGADPEVASTADAGLIPVSTDAPRGPVPAAFAEESQVAKALVEEAEARQPAVKAAATSTPDRQKAGDVARSIEERVTAAYRDVFAEEMQPRPKAAKQQPVEATSQVSRPSGDSQIDWLDDLASPDAINAQRLMMEDLRASIEEGNDFNLKIVDDDGNSQEMTLRAALAEIDELDDFAESIQFCVKGKAAAE